MFRLVRYSGAAAAVLVLAGLAALLIPVGRTAAGFAEVLDSVRKARNVRFLQVQKLTPSSPEIPLRTTIEGPHFRMEIPGAMVLVADLDARKAVQLNPAAKTGAWLPVDQTALDQALANPVEQVLALGRDAGEPAGREEVDGRPADVYRLKRFRFFGLDTATAKPEDQLKLTLWADPDTHRPVQLVLSWMNRPVGHPETPSVIVMKEFAWDVDTDPALFRVEIPEGYREVPVTEQLHDEAPKPNG